MKQQSLFHNVFNLKTHRKATAERLCAPSRRELEHDPHALTHTSHRHV